MTNRPDTNRAASLRGTLALLLALAAQSTMSEPRSVSAPAVEQSAIPLRAKSANSPAEVWEAVEIPTAFSGDTSGSGSELHVRNVSQPTLSSFLPDPEKATGAAIIVAPGGAYMELSMEREGYTVAKWLQQRGIAAFVLKYRVASTPMDSRQAEQALKLSWPRSVRRRTVHGWAAYCLVDLSSSAKLRQTMVAAREDGIEAVRYVRAHAAQWGLHRNRIGFMGFSAGAVVAIDVALNSKADSRPDLVAAIYGALPDRTAVPVDAPPIFIASASDDPYPWSFGLATYSAWRAVGLPAELHMFQEGGHGFALYIKERAVISGPPCSSIGCAVTGLSGDGGRNVSRRRLFAIKHLEAGPLKD